MQTIQIQESGRIESGPVQFQHPTGTDWPGVFLRGDDCLRLRNELRRAIERTESMFDRQMMPELLCYIDEATNNKLSDTTPTATDAP